MMNAMNRQRTRKSNIELLRIILMCFIVFYHLLAFYVVPYVNSPVYKALYMPLHVAVVCFVLISGYFHITPSIRGFLKLLLPLLFYYLLPLLILYFHGDDMGGVKYLLPISNSPYWFIRTYLYLYLISPLLNKYLAESPPTCLLISLGFISIYMSLSDDSLHDGKNLVFFMFLYVLGDWIRHKKALFDKINCWGVFGVYVILNMALVVLYIKGNHVVKNVVWGMSFQYCRPVLIFNAVTLFLIFNRMSIKSSFINTIGASTFAIYIIHLHPIVSSRILFPIMRQVVNLSCSLWEILTGTFLFTFAIVLISIVIDQLCKPFFMFIASCCCKIEAKHN